jgi:hypothetical protein
MYRKIRNLNATFESNRNLNDNEIRVKIKRFLCFFITEHHAMKVYWGSGSIAPSILNFGASCQFHAPTALPPRKEPLVPTG